MDNIEKIDNVTWYGHCVIHLTAALNDLPNQAKLAFCRDLERFIKRQQRALRDAAALLYTLLAHVAERHRRAASISALDRYRSRRVSALLVFQKPGDDQL
jgi:hypothetical protein